VPSGSHARAAAAAIIASAAALTLWTRVGWPWFLLGWVALMPWLAALDAAPSWRSALVTGLGLCVAFTLGVFWWFGVAVEEYAALPAGSGIALLVLAAPLLQPQFIAAAAARFLSARRGAGAVARGLATAGAYVGCEWLWPKLLGDTIGHGFLASRLLRQSADLFGAPGCTAVLVVANEAMLAVVRGIHAGSRRQALRGAAAAVALVATLAAYGAVRVRGIERRGAAAQPLTVAVVQGGFADYANLREAYGSFEATRRIVDRYLALSAEAVHDASVELLVWPETVYPTTFGSPKTEEGAAFDRRIAGFVAGSGVPLVFGAYDRDEAGREYNAAFVLEPPRDGEGVTFDAYRKTWLFPLTERVPGWLDTPSMRRRLPWLGTWTRGDGPTVLRVHTSRGRALHAVPLICYDAVVPAHARAAAAGGGELLVTMSNDAWFGDGPGTWLHLTVSAFRSIETRRPQVRATTTGISAVIDATGEIRQAAASQERRVLVESVAPVAPPPTLVMRFGDWASPAMLVLACLALVAPRAGRRVRPTSPAGCAAPDPDRSRRGPSAAACSPRR
jgi:apolipoprotein N-acyltransferase